MGVSLGQGEWSVRTCVLKTEPKPLDPKILIFWGILRVISEKEGELRGTFLFVFAAGRAVARTQRRRRDA